MSVETQPLGLLQEQSGQSLSLERFVYGEPVYDRIRPVVEPPALDRPVCGFFVEKDCAVNDRTVMQAQYVAVARFDVVPDVFVRRVSVLPLRVPCRPIRSRARRMISCAWAQSPGPAFLNSMFAEVPVTGGPAAPDFSFRVIVESEKL